MDKPFALIVEDNRDIVALFRHVLDLAGYHTEIVLDGKEAMERIHMTQPDIVLLDLQLPGMTGVEILKTMRSNPALAAIPVVVITAYSNYTDRLPVQPDLLLLKPVDINQLRELVQRLQTGRGGKREPALDPTSGLYSLTFFTERLTFSLERLKQVTLRRFGILFAEVPRWQDIENELGERGLPTFHKGLADQLKSMLRPTDILAWSSKDRCFFALIEEMPLPELTVKIAERVQSGMTEHLRRRLPRLELDAQLGVLVCDPEYRDIQRIFDDIELSRSLLRTGAYSSPAVFDRKVILTHR